MPRGAFCVEKPKKLDVCTSVFFIGTYLWILPRGYEVIFKVHPDKWSKKLSMKKNVITLRKNNIFRWDFFKPHLLDLKMRFPDSFREIHQPGGRLPPLKWPECEIFRFWKIWRVEISKLHQKSLETSEMKFLDQVLVVIE